MNPFALDLNCQRYSGLFMIGWHGPMPQPRRKQNDIALDWTDLQRFIELSKLEMHVIVKQIGSWIIKKYIAIKIILLSLGWHIQIDDTRQVTIRMRMRHIHCKCSIDVNP